MNSMTKRRTLILLAGVLAIVLALWSGVRLHQTKPTFAAELVTLDFDGIQAVLEEYEGTNVGPDNDPEIFAGATGETQMAWTNAMKSGDTVTVALEESVKAADYQTVTVSICVGNWTESTATISAYAVTDTAFEHAAGSVQAGFGNVEATLTLDPSLLADENGEIPKIVIRRTESNAEVGGGQIFFDFIQFVPAQAPGSEVVLDFDGSQAVLKEYEGTNVGPDNDPAVFAGATGETQMAWTGNLADGGTVTVVFDRAYPAADYPALDLRICVGNWTGGTTTVTGYNMNDTEFASPAGLTQTPMGNSEAILTLDTSVLADEDGMVQGVVLRRTESEPAANGQIFFDYTRFYTPEDDYSSKYFEAGDIIANDNPAGIEDGSVVWVPFRQHPTYDPYGYVGSVALGTLSTTVGIPQADGSEIGTLPGYETYENGAYTAVRADKVVWALNVGALKAENYSQLEMTLYFTDWCLGTHQFYVYGSGTTAFSDGEGNPAGYAGSFTVSNPSQRYTVRIDNASALGDVYGEINYIYIVWWGNTADTAGNIAGTYDGTQLWLNEVNLLIEEDVERPVASEEFIESDISDLLPVGEGITFENLTKSEEEGWVSGGYDPKASVSLGAFDVAEFTVTPTYTTNFSFYLLFKAPGAGDTYDSNGIVLWIAGDNTLIGAASNGSYATVDQVKAEDYPEGVFASGSTTKVRMEMIPGYLDGMQSGYFVAVYLNDAEEAFLEAYIANGSVSTGSYLNIVFQDLGEDYTVEIGSAAETPTSADEVMGLSLSTNSGETTFVNPRARINLSYLAVEGGTAEVIVDGAGSYNAETGFLTFDEEGEVTLTLTVTNAFGTFTSQPLTLTYDDGVDDDGPRSCKSSCSSAASGGSMGLLLVLSAGALIAAAVRRRSAR